MDNIIQFNREKLDIENLWESIKSILSQMILADLNYGRDWLNRKRNIYFPADLNYGRDWLNRKRNIYFPADFFGQH